MNIMQVRIIILDPVLIGIGFNISNTVRLFFFKCFNGMIDFSDAFPIDKICCFLNFCDYDNT